MSGLVFDLLVVASLLWTGWRTLTARDAFAAAALFIAFGLLMALAWARLDAPDVALAEAAIGAGLTGALVLDAVGRQRARRRAAEERPPGPRPMVLAGLCLAPVLVLGGAILALGEPAAPIPVAQSLAQSGVSHPVTAVLLNFRAYDTLLEVAVLLLALIGVLAVEKGGRHPAPAAPEPVLAALARILSPVVVAAAVYLFWAGSFRPGGAFQAGAVLAALGVLLRLAGLAAPRPLPGFGVRLVLAAGFLVFLLVAGVLRGERFLQYPADWAGALILAVEASLAVSLGAILAGLFLAAPGPARRGRGEP